MNKDEILAAAKEAPAKVQLDEYREAIESLRDKGYTWREIADFLSERGVSVDHTRIYRMFGDGKRRRGPESRSVEVSRVTFLGEQPTRKRRGKWNLFEIELPSKLGSAITVTGYVWGHCMDLKVEDGATVDVRDAKLVMRRKHRRMPMAYLTMEVQSGDEWVPLEVYIVPKWDVLL